MSKSVYFKNYLLTLNGFKYLLKIQVKNFKLYLQLNQKQQFGKLVTNKFRTLTGGTVYYEYRNIFKSNQINKKIFYVTRNNFNTKYKSSNFSRTIIWLGEEIHKVNCETSILLVESGDFISERFELIPGLFSKTSGIVFVRQKNNLVQSISIKSGLVYEGKKLKQTNKKLYYPGEIIVSNIINKQLAFCETIAGKDNEQLIVRNIELYEFPYSNLKNFPSTSESYKNLNLDIETKTFYSYKSNQVIKGFKNVNLISTVLQLNSITPLNNNASILLSLNKKTKAIDLYLNSKFHLNNHLLPYLKYKNLQSCLLTQQNQFVDRYTLLGYIEALTLNSLEIVKVKIKNKDTKQILLISNENCFTLKTSQFSTKKINEFIISTNKINESGKIIIKNDQVLTLQKGKPYFFPNCKNEDQISRTNLEYKILPVGRISPRFKTQKFIYLNYYDLTKLNVKKRFTLDEFSRNKIDLSAEFSKFFLRKF